MDGRGFGFVTYADPAHAQAFLEVGSGSVALMLDSSLPLLACRVLRLSAVAAT